MSSTEPTEYSGSYTTKHTVKVDNSLGEIEELL